MKSATYEHRICPALSIAHNLQTTISLQMGMKNAAYTQGFHAGFQSILQSGIQSRHSKTSC